MRTPSFKITYGRTAYVLECGAKMMDLLRHTDLYAQGYENYCTTLDDIESELQNQEDIGLEFVNPDLRKFLKEVVDSIEGEVGDVIFSR